MNLRSLWIAGGLLWMQILLPSALFSQDCHLHLYGYVKNAHGNQPMGFASVMIKETGNGTVADESGYFHLEGFCPGVYTVVASRIGANYSEMSVRISADTGIVVYLQEAGILLEKVEIRAEKPVQTSSQSSQTLSGAMLEAGKGLGLGESLKRLPGVTTLNTGATIAKPVIQGMHSNRILILNNGVRQEGQQWGAEHAPEIDPFLAQQISVIKGAGSIRYGSDGLGGIILVQPAPLRSTPGLSGEINLQGMSNGQTGIASAMLETRLKNPRLPLAGRVQGTIKRGGNLRTPQYFLNNTGVAEYNFSWTGRIEKDRWNSEVFYSRFYSQLGILRDAHIGNLTDLQNAIERGRPLQDGSFSYFLGRPQQQILHELVKWTTQVSTGNIGKLEFQASRQFNRRAEFDAHRRFNALPETADEAQIILEITTHQLSSNWEHRWMKHLHGDAGLTFMTQSNTTDRGALLPNFDNRVLGAYWIERWKNYPKPLEFELGLRYDLQQISAGPFERDTNIRERNFRNLSGSFGAIYAFNERWKLRANIATAWRAPHVSELYSQGVHHGSASYEQGNADLEAERAWNNSLTLEWNSEDKRSSMVLTGFYNHIDNYIFLNPMPQPVLTIRGAFPAFEYAQANARLTGADAQFTLQAARHWILEAQASVLQSWNDELGDFLVFMPPNQFRYTLKYHAATDAKTPQRFIQLSAVHMLRQTWAPDGIDYAPAPDGYLRFDLEALYTLRLGNKPLELGCSVINLLNTEYRDYLNRLRYFAAETGRNVIFRIKMPFG